MAKMVIPDVYEGLPVVTAAVAQGLDRRAGKEYGITVQALMENAGKEVADAVLEWVASSGQAAADARIVVCCGRGNNGGDGLAAARYLKAAAPATAAFVAAAKDDRPYAAEVAENLERAKAAGVPVAVVDRDLAELEAALAGATHVVDALLGTGSMGKPAGTVHKMIQAVTRSKKPVASVDIPSGLAPDTGYHSGAFITAQLTLTLGLAKKGLLATHAQRNVGKLKVLDIGFPKELLRNP